MVFTLINNEYALLLFSQKLFSALCTTQSHGTKLYILVSKLRSGTSKTMQLVPVHLDLPLFWKSHCATCSPVYIILYHVTGSCKGPQAKSGKYFQIWFFPDLRGKNGGVLSMRMQVILDSSFARPGSAPIWGGKKGEFRDWTSQH